MGRYACASLGDGLVVVVRHDGRYAVIPSENALSMGAEMDGDIGSSVPISRGMLEGALFAGRERGAAGRELPPQPPLSMAQWVLNLVSSHQTTMALPRSFLIASARLHEEGRFASVDFVLRKYEEEKWHYRLAVSDLEAIGFDADELVAAVTVRSATQVCDHVLEESRTMPAIGVVGMAYVGERASLEVDQRYIDRINALFPAGVRPTRCLRVHSAVGSDPAHVDDIVGFAANLPPLDRRDLVRAAYRAARTFFDFAWHRQTDLELLDLCAAHGVAVPSLIAADVAPAAGGLVAA